MGLQCLYPDCSDGHIVGEKFCNKHLKTPFTTKAEVNAYKRGVRDGIQQAIGKKEKPKVNTHGMGDQQVSCLRALVEHGAWKLLCGWIWDTHSGTTRYMRSFVKRGLAVVSSDGTYYPNEAAKLFISDLNRTRDLLEAVKRRRVNA